MGEDPLEWHSERIGTDPYGIVVGSALAMMPAVITGVPAVAMWLSARGYSAVVSVLR